MVTVIAFVDDQDIHFTSLRDFLLDICRSMHIKYDIRRVFLTPDEEQQIAREVTAPKGQLRATETYRDALIQKIEDIIALYDPENTRVVLIFDNLMQLPGGPFYLEDYIGKLWKAPRVSIRSRIPVIIWAEDTSRNTFARLGKRPKSAIVSGTPTVGDLGLKALEDAVRDALS